MNLQQAQALIPNVDHVIINGEIYKFIQLCTSDNKYYFLRITKGVKHEFWGLEACHLLGDHNGCFDSSVPPPLDQSKMVARYSDDVYIKYADGFISVACYDHRKKQWCFQYGQRSDNFKWCFPPS